jgi:hypothetical protein
MAKIPDPVYSRSVGLIAWIDQFYWAWRESRLVRSETCEVHETKDGVQALPVFPKSSQTSATTKQDFTLYDASDPTSGPAIGVTFGSVFPAGNTTLAAGVNPYPNDFSAAGMPPWAWESAAGVSGFVWFVVTVNPDPAGDGSQPPQVTGISLDNGPSIPQSDANNCYYLLGGAYGVAGTTLTVLTKIGFGDQQYTYCGGAHYVFPMASSGPVISVNITEPVIEEGGGGGGGE